MLVKVHESYRKVVAVCDAELLGKRFVEGQMQLDVKKDFYRGDKMEEDRVVKLLQEADKEDATFNLVGERAVSAGIKAGIVDAQGVIKIAGIPHALALL